jgi:hypothetical protein
MAAQKRGLADRLEVGAPALAALGARALSHAPGPLRRRALRAAFDRARDAFNRGDLEVVFALFDEGVTYVPPPALYEGPPLQGREAVFEFWREVLGRYESVTIENLLLEEADPRRFVRCARLRHRAADVAQSLGYDIVQTTELRGGRVVRQVNEAAPPLHLAD